MNKKLIMLIIAVLVIVLSCSKPAKTENSITQTGNENEESIDFPGDAPLGVFLIDGHYCFENDAGRMVFKAYLNAGDTVNWTDEKKDAVRDYDGVTRTYYRVELQNPKKETEVYWVHDYYIAGPAVPAVITSADAVLYTKPDLSSVARSGTVTLPKYTIVAMTEDDDLADDFIPIAAQRPNGRVEGRYVRLKDISWDTNDIGGVKLAQTASVTTIPAARRELLENAMEMISKGKNLNGIPLSVDYNPALVELELTNNLELLDNMVEYAVTAETVNKRELPGTAGNSTGTMAQGQTFWVKARTKNEITLNIPGEEDENPKGLWLLTEEGNWVFSAYAVPNPVSQ